MLAIDGKKAERLQDILGLRLTFASSFLIERQGQQQTLEVPDTILMMDYVRRKGPPYRPYRLLLVIDSVLPGSGAEKAGIRTGDTLWVVQGKPVFEIEVLPEWLKQFAGDTIEVVVRRGQLDTLLVPLDTASKMGVALKAALDYPRRPYTVGQAFRYALVEGWEFIYYNALGLWYILTGQVSLKEGIHSPIAIARLYGGELDWARFWRLTAILSFILAFVNVLPIPALDGGYALLILIEMLTGYRPGPKFMEYYVRIGVVLLLTLMAYAFIKDLIVVLFGG